MNGNKKRARSNAAPCADAIKNHCLAATVRPKYTSHLQWPSAQWRCSAHAMCDTCVKWGVPPVVKAHRLGIGAQFKWNGSNQRPCLHGDTKEIINEYRGKLNETRSQSKTAQRWLDARKDCDPRSMKRPRTTPVGTRTGQHAKLEDVPPQPYLHAERHTMPPQRATTSHSGRHRVKSLINIQHRDQEAAFHEARLYDSVRREASLLSGPTPDRPQHRASCRLLQARAPNVFHDTSAFQEAKPPLHHPQYSAIITHY